MKILVFSDSHNSVYKMKTAIEKHKRNCDIVIFLGDGLKDIEYIKDSYPQIAFYTVKGNCDLFATGTEDERLLSIEGIKFFVTHGHLYGVKYGYGKIAQETKSRGASVALFGHTHVPFDNYIEVEGENVHLFNPGSIGTEGYFGVINISGGVVVSSHGKIF